MSVCRSTVGVCRLSLNKVAHGSALARASADLAVRVLTTPVGVVLPEGRWVSALQGRPLRPVRERAQRRVAVMPILIIQNMRPSRPWGESL